MKPLSTTKSLDKVIRGRHISPSKDTRFGMPSRLKGDQDDEMSKLMKQGYMREYLQNMITRNAMKEQKDRSKSVNSKSLDTRTNLLRTSKNAINILQKNLETTIEDLKNSKADKNEISFSAIGKKHFQLRKRFILPPLLHHLATSNQSLPSNSPSNQTLSNPYTSSLLYQPTSSPNH
jgi:hypothetical protein